MNESVIVIPDGAKPFKAGIGFKNISGQTFGRLTGLRPVYRLKGHLHWEFQCSCGRRCIAWGTAVRNGDTRSCGCLASSAKQILGAPVKSFPEHSVWRGMIKRCYLPTAPDYKYYGARGISVCDEWRNSFVAFYRDMGPRPDGMTLDRKDNKGNYSKENCRWAASIQQGRNKTINVIVDINGEYKCVSDWLDHFGLRKTTYVGRLKLGWDRIRALTTPPPSKEAGVVSAAPEMVMAWVRDSAEALGLAKAPGMDSESESAECK